MDESLGIFVQLTCPFAPEVECDVRYRCFQLNRVLLVVPPLEVDRLSCGPSDPEPLLGTPGGGKGFGVAEMLSLMTRLQYHQQGR